MLSAKLLATSAVVLGLTLGAAASIAAAQQPGNQTGQPESRMMGDRAGGMTGMMGMMGADTAQMNRMIENCNRLMESMAQTPPNAPSPPATPGPEKQG